MKKKVELQIFLIIVIFFLFCLFRYYLGNQAEISKKEEKRILILKYTGNPKAIDSIISTWKKDSTEKLNQPLHIPF